MSVPPPVVNSSQPTWRQSFETVVKKISEPGATHEKAKAIGSTCLEIGAYAVAPVTAVTTAVVSGIAPETAKKTYTFIGKNLKALWDAVPSNKTRFIVAVGLTVTAYSIGVPPWVIGGLVGSSYSSNRVFTPLTTGTVSERVEKGLGPSVIERAKLLQESSTTSKSESKAPINLPLKRSVSERAKSLEDSGKQE